MLRSTRGVTTPVCSSHQPSRGAGTGRGRRSRTHTGTTRPTPPRAFDDLIVREVERYAVRPQLVRAIIKIESAFNPLAGSHKGAMGLMRLMPGTAANLQVSNPYDPARYFRGRVRCLCQLLDHFDGNEQLTLAAYNDGPEAVAGYGNQVPPSKEIHDSLRKIQRTVALSDRRSAPMATNQQTIYRAHDVINERQVPTCSDVPRPKRLLGTPPVSSTLAAPSDRKQAPTS